ncbi:alpha/beta hydrolase [Tropicimonas sp.]|uniref:alpha/beta hydrolase n=1 Tax=Tropicimonas sp. TaxID=2067044 RepID=UPI003A89C1E6
MPDENAREIGSHQGWALERHAAGDAAPDLGDVLFLHGIASGSWVWTPDWLRHFTGAGYTGWTITLPGRPSGASMASDPAAAEQAPTGLIATPDTEAAIESWRMLPAAPLFDGPDLDDYSRALEEAMDTIGRPVTVVSHSLGGAVVQNSIRRGFRPAATVLLCSVPPYGLWRASFETAMCNPLLWMALARFSLFGVSEVDTGLMRRNLFPGGITEAEFQRLLPRFTDESLAATIRTTGFPPFAPLPGPRADMLVIGASQDRLLPLTDICLTGLYYGVAPKIVRGAGHMPMYEPAHAGETAGLILDWLDTRR